MKVSNFKNLDEIPWGKHRLMGNFSLRQNEQERNDSYREIYEFFCDKIFKNNKELEKTLVEGDRKKTLDSFLSGELYWGLRQKLRNTLFIPCYKNYSGIVKEIDGDRFVLEVQEDGTGYRCGYQYEPATFLERHTEIFSFFDELLGPRQNYIDFELSHFKKYIDENDAINDGTKQFILDVIQEVLNRL